MPRTGRPPALTPAVITELEQGILVGMPYDLACDLAGISFQTFNEYRKGNWPRSIPIALRKDFSERIKRAEARAVFEALATIKAASLGNLPDGALWTAAAWLLERRYPHHFGRRNVQVTGAGGGPIQHEHSHEIRDAVAKRAAREGLDMEELMAEVDELLAEARAA